MDLGQLTLRDLEYLVASAEYLHFGRAAQSLAVSQPTLSEQIKKLETLLAVKLFERTNRRVQLTPEGTALVQRAKKVIIEAKLFIDESKTRLEPLSGEFHLGAIATVGPYYFPFVLGPLIKSFPKLDLVIHEGMTDKLLEDLDSGKLDAVIASNTFKDDRFRVYPLYYERFLLAAPKNRLFKLKSGKVSIKEVDSKELILLSEGNCLKDETLNLCSMKRSDSTSKIQASSLETLRHLVAAGNGITMIPELAVNSDHRLKHLISYYSFQENNAGRNIVLVSRENYSRPLAIRMLLSKLKTIKIS
jgi:LysR family hydrogen peroxide-inducible transcriptional activator